MIYIDLIIAVIEFACLVVIFYYGHSSNTDDIYLKTKRENFEIIKPNRFGIRARPVTRRAIKKALKNADDTELIVELKKKLKQKDYFVISLLLLFVIPIIYLWIKAAFDLF